VLAGQQTGNSKIVYERSGAAVGPALLSLSKMRSTNETLICKEWSPKQISAWMKRPMGLFANIFLKIETLERLQRNNPRHKKTKQSPN
jgi:hypothetical protein